MWICMVMIFYKCMDISSAWDQIYIRFLKICNKMEISDNVRVIYLKCCSIASPKSIIGTNLLKKQRYVLIIHLINTFVHRFVFKTYTAYLLFRSL